MSKRSTNIYLGLLLASVLLWMPLYPALFALSSDQLPFAKRFWDARPRYVYFGDSVLATTSPCETDHRTVFDFLPPAISVSTEGFNDGAENAGLWRDTARFVASWDRGSVAAAIIPINMGVFSLGWEHNSNYDFHQGRLFYILASGHFGLTEYLGYFWGPNSLFPLSRSGDIGSAAAKLPVRVGQKIIGLNQDIAIKMSLPRFPCNVHLPKYARGLALHFAYNYGAPVSASDPYFMYLDETVAQLKAAHIQPILYLTPLNVQDISRFGGPEVKAQLETNIALIKSIAKNRGWQLADLSAALPSADFITRECGCEHVDAKGRALIAGKVAAMLRQDHL